MGQAEGEVGEAGEGHGSDDNVTLSDLRLRSKQLLAEALEDEDWKVRFKAIRLILGKGDVFDVEGEAESRRRSLAEEAEEALRGR